MPLDPNIILQGQAPQLQNPMDAMGRAMQFKQLSDQSYLENLKRQQMTQEFGDQQAIRQAYANNTKIDPNGGASLNRAGIMGDLAKSAPHLVPNMQQNFAQNDATVMKAKIDKIAANAQLLNGVTDQKTYDQVKQQALSMGSNPNEWPDQYDPNVVRGMQAKALTYKDQLEAQAKQQGLDIQKQELGVKKQDLGLRKQDLQLKRDQYIQNKQQDAAKEVMSSLESARGAPDVSQALTDRYNAGKLKSLVYMNGDPNKLNPAAVTMVAAEAAKIAQGGVPQMEELKSLAPSNAKMEMARAAEKFKSQPTPANQAAFLQMYNKYADTIAGDANSVIKNKYERVIAVQKPYLHKNDYSNFQKNYLDPFKGSEVNGGMPVSNGQPGGQPSGAGGAPAQSSAIHPALQNMSLDDLMKLKASRMQANGK